MRCSFQIVTRFWVAQICWIGVLLLMPQGVHAKNEPTAFRTWMESFREEALQKGIDADIFSEMFQRAAYVPSLMEKSDVQVNSLSGFKEYRLSVMTDVRLNRARQQMKLQRGLLQKIEQQFGVKSRYVVAIWAVESEFGQTVGNYYVPSVLATYAYAGDRKEFYRNELLTLLKLVQRGDITDEQLTGSEIGALGQPQMLPSQFDTFAVDYDGDGRRDIWNSIPDSLATIANFLAAQGFDETSAWGRPVFLSSDDLIRRSGLSKAVDEWHALGVKNIDGSELPESRKRARLIVVDGNPESAYLVYENFDRLLRWNQSESVVLTMAEFADTLRK